MTSPTQPTPTSDPRLESPCPQCGMPLNVVGTETTSREGVTYCCAGCAQGGECTCDSHGHR